MLAILVSFVFGLCALAACVAIASALAQGVRDWRRIAAELAAIERAERAVRRKAGRRGLAAYPLAAA